jgi:aquaporin Z
MANTTNARILVAELIGTAVLIMGGPGSAILAGESIGIYGVSIAFGLSLLIMAYVIGPISGCHINPAVSLALLVKKKITNAHAASAVIGQIIGSIIGAAIIFVIVQTSDTIERGQFAANQYGQEGFASMGAAIIVEIVFTALFVYVILATTTKRFAPAMGGLVVGLMLALIHLVTIPIDNTSVNPARSLATALFAETPAGGTAPLAQLWVFILFPLIGAIVGAVLWSFSNADD